MGTSLLVQACKAPGDLRAKMFQDTPASLDIKEIKEHLDYQVGAQLDTFLHVNA